MAITKQDIQDEGFEHALRGYDVGQVDIFLERVANEVDAMNKQIVDLETQLREAREELAAAHVTISDYGQGEEVASANLEQAGLVERELRSELEIAQSRADAMEQRAEAAEAKLETMQGQLEEKTNLDNAIAEAFISAQRSAAQIKEDARAEGERIYHESEIKAREFIRESLAKKAAIENEVKALSEYSQKFREQYLEMLERFTAHAKEEFNTLANQSVTDAQIEAELPSRNAIDLKASKVVQETITEEETETEVEKNELPRLTTQQIPQINIPSILPDLPEELDEA